MTASSSALRRVSSADPCSTSWAVTVNPNAPHACGGVEGRQTALMIRAVRQNSLCVIWCIALGGAARRRTGLHRAREACMDDNTARLLQSNLDQEGEQLRGSLCSLDTVAQHPGGGHLGRRRARLLQLSCERARKGQGRLLGRVVARRGAGELVRPMHDACRPAHAPSRDSAGMTGARTSCLRFPAAAGPGPCGFMACAGSRKGRSAWPVFEAAKSSAGKRITARLLAMARTLAPALRRSARGAASSPSLPDA